MRDYRKQAVYHLLDQLILDAYAAMREMPGDERDLVGIPLLQSVTRATTCVVHGCLTRNTCTLLPYVEESHALIEEAGQHLRMCRKLGLLHDGALEMLTQRHQSCTRLLLQWRQSLLLTEEERQAELQCVPWPESVAEECEPPAKRRGPYARKARGRGRGKP